MESGWGFDVNCFKQTCKQKQNKQNLKQPNKQTHTKNKTKNHTKMVKQTTSASFAYMTFTATVISEFSFHL